jgi:hypothetical protein
MFPAGETFSTEASAREATEVFHTFLVDVKLGGMTTKANPTPRDVRLEGRKVSLAAAGVISAFLPHQKFAEILDNQVVNMDSVRKAVEYFSEIKYIAKLPYVDRLRLYVPQFVLVPSVDGSNNGQDTLEDLDITINPTEYKLLARKAIRRFERDEVLKDQLYNTEEGQRLLAIFQAE